MDRDYAYRFSDETYSSKEEVKKVLNLSSIDHIWDVISNYRKLYYKVLDLFSNERKPFSICLCNGIVHKVIKLEKKIMKLDVKKNQSPNFNFNNYKSILNIMCSFNNINEGSSTVIEGIILQNLINYPRQYNIINNYYLSLRDISSRYASPFNEMTVKRIYAYLLYGNANQIDNLSNIYRSTELESTFDPFLNFRHYEGASVEKIPLIMDTLYDYILDSKEFPLINGSLIFFYIMYFKPFECFNEEMAVLLTKYYFMHEEDDLTSMQIEKILMNLNDVSLRKIFYECERSLDITYFINYFLDYIDSLLKEEENVLIREEEQKMQKEILVDDLKDNIEAKEEIILPLINEDKVDANSISSFDGITFERKVSMPIIPKGLDEKDALIVAENLLELCPTLKKGQAEFYARHCTIGKYYTIQQYKLENDVAYETARTSMDNLAELGFYKKEKIRNKFIYTPIIRS